MSQPSTENGRRLDVLRAAVENPQWDYRTIDGLAEELAIPPSDVASMLADHPEVVRKSVLTDRRGEPLFTARSRRPSLRERIQRFRLAL